MIRNSYARQWLAVTLLWGASCSGSPASPDLVGRHALDLYFRTDVNDPCFGGPFFLIWQANTDLTVAVDGSVSGWMAQTGLQVDAGISAFTLGSTAVTGAVRDGDIELSLFELSVEGSLPPTDSLTLTRVVLDPTSTELVAGSVQGTWHQREFDTACDLPFSSTLSLEPDTVAPTVTAATASVLPFEAVVVRLSEPTQAASAIFGASANGLPVASDVVFRPDPGRDGFVTHAWIAPRGLWPAGFPVDVATEWLVDPIGNSSAAAAVTLDVPLAPTSDSNAGFEAGGLEWISGDPDLQFSDVGQYYDDNGVLTSFAAPEGTIMAQFAAESTALAGYLVAPPGATQILFEGSFTDVTSVADLQQQAGGLIVTLADEQSRREVFDGGQMPAPIATRFSGFSTVVLDLPANAASGFWISFGCRGFAPPVHQPVCFVDHL
ncbi:MAG: hypothetical protein AAB131_17000, partial [Actinomycetota bacterium]